jgi:hypothetical protein
MNGCNNREKTNGKWNRKQANRVATVSRADGMFRIGLAGKSQSRQDGFLTPSALLFPPVWAGIVNDYWLIWK